MPQCEAHPTTLQFVIFVELPKLASHYLKPLENLLDDTRSSSFGVWLVVNGAAARSLRTDLAHSEQRTAKGRVR